MNITLVVPCYNEAKRLPQDEFVSFVKQHSNISVLFVNDGSTDNTLEILQSLEKANERIYCLNLERNCGKAEAVRMGMLNAETRYDNDYIAFWDADLATPLSEVIPMAEWAEKGYDVVTGLRLMRLGAKVRRKSMRHYLGRCFATAASMMLGLPVYDTQCGAKMFRTNKVPNLFFERFVTRWLFDVEILARYNEQFGSKETMVKVYEYPLYQWQDIAGSRLKFRDFFKAPFELIRIHRTYVPKEKQ